MNAGGGRRVVGNRVQNGEELVLRKMATCK
jgi:hypothetical protein